MRADRVVKTLCQGPALSPNDYRTVADHFDVLVLAAIETQPSARLFSGNITVIHAPLMDDAVDGLSDTEIRIVDIASRHVADAVARRQRVLVTCQMGLNRSGVIVGAALIRLGVPWFEAVALIREARGEDALCNERFVEYLQNLR